jgi:hypothetical protein
LIHLLRYDIGCSPGCGPLLCGQLTNRRGRVVEGRRSFSSDNRPSSARVGGDGGDSNPATCPFEGNHRPSARFREQGLAMVFAALPLSYVPVTKVKPPEVSNPLARASRALPDNHRASARFSERGLPTICGLTFWVPRRIRTGILRLRRAALVQSSKGDRTGAGAPGGQGSRRTFQ